MYPPISIGAQSFEFIRQENTFYIDKTDFISEWWESKDTVTLITRPRRFGKTLNLHMLECFFSSNYAQRGELFEGLSIWTQKEYRKLQGTVPVISLSFAGIKASGLRGARNGIVKAIADAYEAHRYILDCGMLSEEEKSGFNALRRFANDPSPDKEIDPQFVTASLNQLSAYLHRFHKRKVFILLDEYDTPLQEAYLAGYWKELVPLVRELFNCTFKTNRHMDRALLTGITHISKESIFSDLNNLKVVTTTSGSYSRAFGFTEQEVFQALDERGLASEKAAVKFWYDGFTFGNATDIYNPWSITSYLDTGRLGTYWTDTSSNALVSELIRRGTPELKMQMEELLSGKALEVCLDEQIIFDQLCLVPGAVWSLFLASGYLRPVSWQYHSEYGETSYQLRITNHETELMFRKMISRWFPDDLTSYHNFKKALLQGDLKYMNRFLNEVAAVMFSSFDTGNQPSEHAQPERFYHGFVLGLIVDLSGKYHIRSNRESGFGRYDVIMEPRDKSEDAIIMEFKVHEEEDGASLEDTVQSALRQIERKAYDTDLIARGIPKEHIRHYGLAFHGKHIRIG